MRHLARFLFFPLLAFLPPLVAQSDATRESSKLRPKTADEEWEVAKNLGRPNYVGASAGAPAAAHVRTRETWIAALLSDAAKLRKFSADHPAHVQAKEAKRLEALALLQAWQAGDTSQASRRNDLVAQLRRDASLPDGQRSEIAAFSENIGVEKRHPAGPERLAAYEQVARSLIAEFPDVPDAYEALLYIARDRGDDPLKATAAELASTSGAPAWVKSEARSITTRYGLLGNSIVEPTRAIIAENNPFVSAAGRPLVIYTWSSSHAPSITQAKEIAARAPASAAVIGVCLDQRDLAPARAKAAAEALPGEQIYDWLGRRGEIAEALGAVDPGLVYIADAGGIARSVSAHRNLSAAFAALPAN